MKSLFTFLFSMVCVYALSAQAVLTAVFDGPLPGGTPKGVEIYITDDIADLSMLGVSSANNGSGPTGMPEYTFPAESASAGQYIYLSNEADNFEAFFGFAADYVDDMNGSVNINGDDAIELFFDGAVIDVFGDVNMDGTGTPWEHLDGWAARLQNTGPDGSTFQIGSWSFSGVDALDGEMTNEMAAIPVPLKSYTGGTVLPDHTVNVVSNEFQPQLLVVDQGDIVEWDCTQGVHNVNGSLAAYPDNTEDFSNGPAAPAPWTYQYTFTSPGYNEYHCDPHLGLGMVGSVMVREEGDHFVEVVSNDFIPKDITIELGETVVWTNVDGIHNTNGSTNIYPDNPEGFSSGAAGTNWTYSHTFINHNIQMNDSTLYHVNRWDYLQLSLHQLIKDPFLPMVMSSIEISGQFWERDKNKSEELTDDYKVILPQVKLCYDNLLLFSENMTKWLEGPFEFGEELSGIEYQSFVISFHKNDDPTMNDIYKPWVNIIYSGGHVNCLECEFLVDQSCVSNFSDELKQSIELLNN